VPALGHQRGAKAAGPKRPAALTGPALSAASASAVDGSRKPAAADRILPAAGIPPRTFETNPGTKAAGPKTVTAGQSAARRGGELAIEGRIAPYVEVLPAGKDPC
jgi:hypothetical protein